MTCITGRTDQSVAIRFGIWASSTTACRCCIHGAMMWRRWRSWTAAVATLPPCGSTWGAASFSCRQMTTSASSAADTHQSTRCAGDTPVGIAAGLAHPSGDSLCASRHSRRQFQLPAAAAQPADLTPSCAPGCGSPRPSSQPWQPTCGPGTKQGWRSSRRRPLLRGPPCGGPSHSTPR